VRARPASLFAAAVPAAAFALGRLLAPAGPEGLFRAGLAALLTAVLAFAFVPLRPLAALLAAALAALLAGGGFLLAGADLGEAAAAGALVLGHACAAAGLAALGRAVGAGQVGAGAVSAAVLALALQGLFWADPAAERLPRERRREFRQAVLDVDGATALAYDAARFDRFHHPPIYADVPLASSTYERPNATSTGLAWGALGCLAGGVATIGRRSARVRRGSRSDGESGP
jgi:hypothetical protein